MSSDPSKKVVSLRLSPPIHINRRDYDQVVQYEREHPEIYNHPHVFEVPCNLDMFQQMTYQAHAFNYMFYKMGE